MRYDALLFDSDGVLVEPPAAETQAAATRAAFESIGIADPDETDVRAIVDGVTDTVLEACCRHYGLDPETFWAARERHDEDSQLAAFCAGDRRVYDDVEAIRDLPEPRGIVSNNHDTTIEFVCRHFGLEPLFECTYGRPMTIESLQRKKPEPYYLERALETLSADTALYVGDSESDLLAAERAGLDSVFVRRPHNRETRLAVEPDYEVRSLTAISSIVES